MSLTGGKRKVNKSLKAWVAFVKKVQKEENLSYKEAIHRAKVRKDKGEKWMKGGDGDYEPTTTEPTAETEESMDITEISDEMPLEEQDGGRRRRRRGTRRRASRRR